MHSLGRQKVLIGSDMERVGKGASVAPILVFQKGDGYDQGREVGSYS
jgi:hypothetical protein